MQIRLTIVDPARSGASVDVAVQAPAGATLDALRPLLLEVVGSGPDASLYVDGRAADDGCPVGVPPLVEGAVLTVGRGGCEAGAAAGTRGGLLELHVVGGPDSGQVHRLLPGVHELGRTSASLRVQDPDVSRTHAVLEVGSCGVAVRDLGSTNGTWVDDAAAGSDGVPLTLASRLRIGSSTMQLSAPGTRRDGAVESPPAATRTRGDGQVEVNRSPRILPSTSEIELRLPRRPKRREPQRVPMIAMLLPLLVAGPVALLLGSPYFLLFAVLSPVMLLANHLGDRRAGGSEHRRAMEAYEADTARVRQQLTEALTEEAVRRRRAAPDNARLLQVVSGPLDQLWQRRRGDEDSLVLRVGTAGLPSRVRLVDPDAADGTGSAPAGERTRPQVENVPVTVALAEVGVLGVAGPWQAGAALVRSLLAQVAGWHSPQDVSIVVLAAQSPGRAVTGAAWAWTRWLPHTRPDGQLCPEGACDAMVGLDGDGADVDAGVDAPVGSGGANDASPVSEQLQRRVSELEALVRARHELARTVIPGPWQGHRLVVLLDGAQRLRAVPGLAQVLGDGPAVGVLLICLDVEQSRLPVECRATITVTGEAGTRLELRVSGDSGQHAVVGDCVSERWAHRLARSLAPLRDATPAQDGACVPDSVRLLDELDFDATDADQLAVRWRARGRSTSALLGVAAGGQYVVDLRRDGPHVLVAGTTGSGKSELLQTLIASLALANRPDEICFVLVDYKGGAAFEDCARLPHTVGLVTDLDGHLTERALVSLAAELRRRERLLRGAGAKDIDDYLASATPGSSPMPRLVLVIDEFRVLAEELPDFISGLVRIAAVGRSLGVHLVLATQRPAGIVSADIKANVNLRIGLRMRDQSDSEDVIDARDAASLSARTPGRALARSGANPLVAFQTARVGGAPEADDVVRPSVTPLPWRQAGDPLPQRAPAAVAAGASDLARLVESARAAARQLGCRPTPSPWLPGLPTSLTLDDLAEYQARDSRVDNLGVDGGEGSWASPWALPWGLVDLPDEQAQRVLSWDLATDGHLLVAGTARTGRTSLLRTLAASAAGRLSPADVHLYGMDGSGAGLQALARLPHTGAVVGRDEVTRGDHLLQRLVDEMVRRQELLAALGCASLAEQREAAERDAASGKPSAPLAHLMLLVDGWDGLQQTYADYDGGRVLDLLQQLVREGAATGIKVIIAGDRSVLMSRLGSCVPDKIVLRMADPTDLVLAGVSSRQVPGRMPPGRALLLGGQDAQARDVQIALLARPVTGAAQSAELHVLTDRALARWDDVPPGRRPFRVEPLPAFVPAHTLTGQGASDRSARWVLVGVGGDELRPVGLELGPRAPAAVIAGPSGSGRSTALTTMARWLLDHDSEVAIVVPRPSPLADLATAPGVLGCFDPSQADGLAAALAGVRSPVVLVDDAELVSDRPVEQVLLEVLRTASTTGSTMVVAGSNTQMANQFRGITVAARSCQQGVLLDPSGICDGELLGVRIPRGRGAGHRPPGRGVLVHGRRQVDVQVAFYAAQVSARQSPP